MSISARHTLLACFAAAALAASALAQVDGAAGGSEDHVAVDVAAAGVLSAESSETPPDLHLAGDLESAEPERIDARFTGTQDTITQDTADDKTATKQPSHDIDDPPVAGDIATRPPGGRDSSAATNDGAEVIEAVPADADQYIDDDWVYHDDSSFAWLISSGTWLHRGQWFSQTDATMVHRSTAPRQFLTDIPLIFQGQTFFSDAMTTESAGFGYEPGLRVTVGKYLGRDGENRDRTLEFGFWGLNEWTSQHAVAAVDPSNTVSLFRTPLDRGIGAFNFSTDQQYTYESDLTSFEINAKISRRLGRDRLVLKPDGHWERQCDPGRTPTFLAGFRTIHIGEDFSFTAQRPVLALPNQSNVIINFPAADGRYDIGTQNRLFGVQLGAELYQQHCQWSWGVRGKVGGYANFAEQETTVRVTDTFAPLYESTRDERATDVQLALGLEFGLVGTYQIRPNIALRCGYDFIFLQGLALAPQQLDFNAAPTPNVRSGSHQFLDGGSIGLELVW